MRRVNWMGVFGIMSSGDVRVCVVPAKFVVETGKLLWGRLQAFGNAPKVFRLKYELFQNREDLIFPLSVNSQRSFVNRNITAVSVPTTNFA